MKNPVTLKKFGSRNTMSSRIAALDASLASYIDRKILVLLCDGKKLLGTLRCFDRFANVVLEGACERVIVGHLYSDIAYGVYAIRGENVVLIGELDEGMDELPQHMTNVSAEEIQRSSPGAESRKGCIRFEEFTEKKNGVS